MFLLSVFAFFQVLFFLLDLPKSQILGLEMLVLAFWVFVQIFQKILRVVFWVGRKLTNFVESGFMSPPLSTEKSILAQKPLVACAQGVGKQWKFRRGQKSLQGKAEKNGPPRAPYTDTPGGGGYKKRAAHGGAPP